jgi:hypothetical protein
MSTEYSQLSKAERHELSERLAAGCISRSCQRSKSDWFNLRLSSGRRVTGAYRWGSECGEFLRLSVR